MPRETVMRPRSTGMFGVSCPTNQTIILCVRPDPEPSKIGAALDGKRPMVQAYTHGPILPDLFEVQRRMVRVLTQKCVTLCVTPIRQLPHFFGKSVVARPKARAGTMFHRS